MKSRVTGVVGTIRCSQARIAPIALAAMALVVLGGPSAWQARADDPPQTPVNDAPQLQWTKYHDEKQKFTMERPQGWSLHVEMNTILAQNPDHTALAAAEIFQPQPGQSAEDYVNALPTTHAELLPGAQVGPITQRQGAGDQVIGKLAYQGADGPGEAHVLCSISPRGNMLFVIAAPAARFKAQSPTLVRILNSIHVDSASASAPTTGSQQAAGTAGPAIKFVQWTDPREHAFTVDIPEGWIPTGGEFHAGILPRTGYRITSPANDMLIQVGDEALPSFQIPNARLMQAYHTSEGVLFMAGPNHPMMFLTYMPAPEFNRWYLEHVVSQAFSDLEITDQSEMKDLAQKLTGSRTQEMQGKGQNQTTAAELDFKGISKQTGKPITGVMQTIVSLTTFNRSPGTGFWDASPTVMGCVADDKQPARQRILLNAFARIQSSFVLDPDWAQKQNDALNAEGKQIKAHIAELTNAQKLQREAQARAAARQQAAASPSPMLRSHWSGSAASNSDFNRKFANYIGDRTDVTNPQTGETTSAPSGFGHYYSNASGEIQGSNSAAGGSGLTELEEH